ARPESFPDKSLAAIVAEIPVAAPAGRSVLASPVIRELRDLNARAHFAECVVSDWLLAVRRHVGPFDRDGLFARFAKEFLGMKNLRGGTRRMLIRGGDRLVAACAGQREAELLT